MLHTLTTILLLGYIHIKLKNILFMNYWWYEWGYPNPLCVSTTFCKPVYIVPTNQMHLQARNLLLFTASRILKQFWYYHMSIVTIIIPVVRYSSGSSPVSHSCCLGSVTGQCDLWWTKRHCSNGITDRELQRICIKGQRKAMNNFCDSQCIALCLDQHVWSLTLTLFCSLTSIGSSQPTNPCDSFLKSSGTQRNLKSNYKKKVTVVTTQQ